MTRTARLDAVDKDRVSVLLQTTRIGVKRTSMHLPYWCGLENSRYAKGKYRRRVSYSTMKARERSDGGFETEEEQATAKT